MRKIILEKLKLDFQKINKNNGFDNDVKLVTTKALSLGDINYSNTPAIEIFPLGTKISFVEDIREYEWEIGVLVYLSIDAVYSDGTYLEEQVENMINDIETLIYDTDLDVEKINGVSFIGITEILPYQNDDDGKAIIYLKLKINYIR